MARLPSQTVEARYLSSGYFSNIGSAAWTGRWSSATLRQHTSIASGTLQRSLGTMTLADVLTTRGQMIAGAAVPHSL